jgi:NAD(P)-dependent dehydrogenase (short-subunit alcohol dehydrogenase family)
VIGDVSSEPLVRRLAEQVHRDYGAVDVLVNNAGLSLIAPAEDATAARWPRVINITLLGPFLPCKYLGAQMLHRRSGSIVNVAAAAGFLADDDMQGFINGVSLPVDGGWVADGSWDALRI